MQAATDMHVFDRTIMMDGDVLAVLKPQYCQTLVTGVVGVIVTSPTS